MQADDRADDRLDHHGDTAGVSARTLGRGLAVVRIFFGVIFLANGLAKVFGWSRVALGDYYIATLITRPESRRILDSLANTDRPGTA